jgi:spore coat polysaccharide biosynthesis protein SpsF
MAPQYLMKKPTINTIIQARMGSSRLPGKVLLQIGEQPMLAHVVERTRMATTIDQVIVATTRDSADDPVAALCTERGYLCYRGSEHDVLDRYYQAASLYPCDVVVRVTADCPLIDPQLVDQTVYALLNRPVSHDLQLMISESDQKSGGSPQYPFDFAANRLPPPWGRTFPIGLDVEVCTFSALERAWQEASLPHEREHVMPYLYDQPGRFRFIMVHYRQDYGNLRWTVDTPEDLHMIRQLYNYLKDKVDFSWLDVLEVYQEHAELQQINIGINHKDYRAVDERRGPDI